MKHLLVIAFISFIFFQQYMRNIIFTDVIEWKNMEYINFKYSKMSKKNLTLPNIVDKKGFKPFFRSKIFDVLVLDLIHLFTV